MPLPKLMLWQIMWVHVNLWLIHEPKLLPNALITFLFSLCDFICLWFQFEKLVLVPIWGTHNLFLLGAKEHVSSFAFWCLIENSRSFYHTTWQTWGYVILNFLNKFSIFTYSILVALCFAIVFPNYWRDLWLLVLWYLIQKCSPT